MTKAKILISRKWPEAIEKKLVDLYDVSLNETDEPLSADDFKSALQNYDAICPTVTDSITAEILNVEPKRCKILANFGVGYNHIDIEAAKANDLTVTNTPGVLTESTADIAMALLLMSSRRCAEGDRLIRSNQWQGWNPTQLLGTDITGAVLGLIGFGRIAIATARKAHHGFGMKIIYFNPSQSSQDVVDELKATRCQSVDEVMQQADFVSIHCPGGAKTRHMINAEMIGLMKPTGYIINTARGDVIDSDALIEALRTKQIAGAGLDVYENEPNLNQKFLTLDNVTLLPHLGSATLSTRTAMGDRVITNLQTFFCGEIPKDKVV